MPSPNRKLPRHRWAVALWAFSLLGFVAWATLPARPQPLQASDQAGSSQPEYLVPQRIPAARMSPADAAVVHAKHRQIAEEAAFFGYDLSAGQWTYDQVVCPEMPDDLLLHYRSQSRHGTESLFTAIVPRGNGRVQVVPVLYHNAMPFHSAVESERTIAVFNRVIPANVAQQATQPDGSWLALGVCYAEVAGAEPRVPQQALHDPGLVKAPLPTLQISEADPNSHIVFTDRDAPGGYLVWTIAIDRKGRVTAASTKSLADYVGRTPSQQEPREKIMQPGAEPREKPMPAGQQPQVVPKSQ